jgi:hypothetical protein
MAGATTAQIMDVTGHRDPKSLRRYTRRELLHDVAAQARDRRIVAVLGFPTRIHLDNAKTEESRSGGTACHGPSLAVAALELQLIQDSFGYRASGHGASHRPNSAVALSSHRKPRRI